MADPRLARGRRRKPRAGERLRACSAPLRPRAAGARVRADAHRPIPRWYRWRSPIGYPGSPPARSNSAAKAPAPGKRFPPSGEATASSPESTIRFSLPASIALRATAWDQASNQNSTGPARERGADDAHVAASRADRPAGRRTELNARSGDQSSDAESAEPSRSELSSSALAQRCATASACPSPGAWRISEGHPVPGAQVQVFAGNATDRGQLVGVVTTDAGGGFTYRALADATPNVALRLPGQSRGASGRDSGEPVDLGGVDDPGDALDDSRTVRASASPGSFARCQPHPPASSSSSKLCSRAAGRPSAPLARQADGSWAIRYALPAHLRSPALPVPCATPGGGRLRVPDRL